MSIKQYLSPKKIAIAVTIFIAGMLFLGGTNSFLAYTNQMEFCTSCHSMQINLEELKETVHYKNASGVQTTCADCHVPKAFFPKVYAKIMAAKDVYHHLIGTIDTREKYEAYRWKMANAVWDKMRSNDSRECRSCHEYQNMDLSEQGRSARKKHARAPMKDKTCIDCHAGIAHFEPDDPADEDEEDEEDEVEKGEA